MNTAVSKAQYQFSNAELKGIVSALQYANYCTVSTKFFTANVNLINTINTILADRSTK